MTEWRAVQLTAPEIMGAYSTAALREIASLNGRLRNRQFDRSADPGGEANIYGALGEQAFSKIVDVHWSMSVGSFHGADIGRNAQVRARSGRNGEDLCIRPGDNLAHWFYLVVCRHFPDVWESPGGIRGSAVRAVAQEVDTRLFVRAEHLSWVGPDE